VKIIFSTYETKEIGGSYLRAISLAESLSQLGHEVTLWTSASKLSFLPRKSSQNGVKIVESVGIFPYKIRRAGFDLFDILFRSISILCSSSNVVHSFNPRPSAVIPGLVKKIFSPKTKWFMDWADLWGKGGLLDRRNGFIGQIVGIIDHLIENWCVKNTPYITAISEDLMKKAKQIRKNKSKIFFLPIGANITAIKPLSKQKARKKLNLLTMNKILVYLYIGSYDAKFLAKVFNQLNQLRSDTFILLLGPDIPEFFKELESKINIKKKIIHPGIVSRSKLPWYLAAGDIMLLPFADKEINRGKFPNKLGDYLAAGKPIIANPTGEVAKLFKREKTGVLVKEDPLEFAQKINSLLNNPKKMKALEKKSRLIAKKISWLRVSKQLEGFYLE
jgi:glycosyltransferase involved in cell wall biosynthesis